MGATNLQIIFKVFLVESVPSIVRGLSITTITLIGYGAMAGALGAGGLGKIGYSYGFQRFTPSVMYMTTSATNNAKTGAVPVFPSDYHVQRRTSAFVRRGQTRVPAPGIHPFCL